MPDRPLRAWLAVGALCFAVACSGSPPVTGDVVRVTERDFRISAPARVAPGDVVLSATNMGPDAHELIVVRAPEGALPLRSDGFTVDEESLDAVIVGALEPGQPGTTRALPVHLAPGRYVLFCNMSGHYLGGMHTELVVG
jgi:uncharacterized cupredoxin-like copper-binding protein